MTQPLSFSYSLLDAEESCPEKARRLFIVRDYKRAWTAAKDGGIDLHTALEHRVKAKTPLPPEHQAFEPLVASFERLGPVEGEVALGVDHLLRPSSFWVGYIRGKYDVVVRDHGRRKALIGDWKSGRADFEKELQLEIGALLLMWNDPAIDTVVGLNVYMKTGKPGRPYTFTRESASPRWGKLLKRVREIELRDRTQVWEKRPGPLCAWCPVASCQHFQGGQGR